jgi:hypothetical protein
VLPTPGPGLVSAGEVEAPPDRNGRELGRTKHDGLVRRAAGSAPSRFMSEQVALPPSWLLLGNSGKPVTLETLSLTKFSKHVFQEQGICDSRKPGT